MVPYDPNISQLMRNISPWLYHGYTMVAVSNPPFVRDLPPQGLGGRDWRVEREDTKQEHEFPKPQRLRKRLI